MSWQFVFTQIFAMNIMHLIVSRIAKERHIWSHCVHWYFVMFFI